MDSSPDFVGIRMTGSAIFEIASSLSDKSLSYVFPISPTYYSDVFSFSLLSSLFSLFSSLLYLNQGFLNILSSAFLFTSNLSTFNSID